GDYVYITKGPDRILVVVAGGAEPYHGAVCSNFGDCQAITKRIPA
ncbi:MAG: hypothetical protein HYX97_06395, partial [Chloroflexi bacterium]|nr:hypothetical protein [Chloroflexota bacterium]